MRKNTNDTDFIRFLKDEKFIEWKLFPTDELNSYWFDFLRQHPEERNNFELAENNFQNINITFRELPKEKKHEAINRLVRSLRKYNNRHNFRRITYTITACAMLLLIFIFYINRDIINSEEDFIATNSYIEGNELESEDIMFITGNKTTSFSNNVDILIDGDKTAQVISEDNETEDISIDKNTMNKLIVPYGKRSKIVLSDGTQVWLNSGSSLEFPSSFSSNNREVFLYGEMYIEVAPEKNKLFYVHTSLYDIKVYGTKFNVSSYAESTSSVVLVEGSIALQTTNKNEILLSPNELSIYSKVSGTFNTTKVDVNPYTSWKDGYLTFDDAPVSEALKQIERYYNLSFNLDEIVSFQGLTCTGKIILSDNLDNVMTALTLISDTKYKKKDKHIFLYKE